MKELSIAFYDTHSYDRQSFQDQNEDFGFHIEYLDFRLNEKTVLSARGFDVVCVFVNDVLDGEVLKTLAAMGIKMVALRCAGFNNVDVDAAESLGITVARVPAYSPHAVAEHALALLLALTRHIPQSYIRTRTGNFTLDGLTGRELNGLNAGIIGTGKIGRVTAEIFSGLGMNICLYDPFPAEEWSREHGFRYVDKRTIFQESDVISLHCPLTETTHHIVEKETLSLMKKDSVILNTGRGALIDSHALVNALKHKEIGGAALDVYEEESRYFFSDWSGDVIPDDTLSRLMTFPNVIITSHQAFLTKNALDTIARTTLENIRKLKEKY